MQAAHSEHSGLTWRGLVGVPDLAGPNELAAAMPRPAKRTCHSSMPRRAKQACRSSMPRRAKRACRSSMPRRAKQACRSTVPRRAKQSAWTSDHLGGLGLPSGDGR